MSATPLVTVSLVTFNGMRWLPGCLRTLERQTLADLELLILDNASTDGTLGWLQERCERDARITLYESAENLGFAKGHNRNIARARGDYVCLLNQDVELDPAFLARCVDAFTADATIGAVQGRLRRLEPDGTLTAIIDTTGLEIHRDRRVVSRGQAEPDGPRYMIAGPVWGADGPAPIYRREALHAARLPSSSGGWEVLDEDFFMYKEDVDLAWRLHLLGWSARYEPSALAWHGRGAATAPGRSVLDTVRADRAIPSWIKVASWRNHRLMQVKNESLVSFLGDLPWIARRELVSLGYMILMDPRRLRAVGQLVRLLPAAIRKRRYLHRRRASVTDPVDLTLIRGASYPGARSDRSNPSGR